MALALFGDKQIATVDNVDRNEMASWETNMTTKFSRLPPSGKNIFYDKNNLNEQIHSNIFFVG